MKKFIFILGLATLFSCSNDESSETKDCGCDKITRQQTGKYNSTNGVVTFNDWVQTSIEYGYSKDCALDGKNWITDTKTSSDGKTVINKGFIVKCK